MASIDLYINTDATNPGTSLVRGVSDLSSATLPRLTAGDSYTMRVFLVNRSGVDTASGAGSYSIKAALGTTAARPTGGTFTISDGSDTTSAIAYDASAATVQTALNAMNTNTGPGGDTVTVEKGATGLYLIKWDTNGAQSLLTVNTASLTPDSDAVVTEEQTGDGSTKEWQSINLAQEPVLTQSTWTPITSPYAGWSGTFPLNTYDVLAEAVDASGGVYQPTFEVELTDPTGKRRTVYQGVITIGNEVINLASTTPNPQASYYTTTESDGRYVINRSDITGLTGGTATDLDGIDTAAGATAAGTLVAVVIGTVLYHYELVSGTDAEDSPNVIRPDDYATTTNEYVWKLRTPKTKAVQGAGAGTAYSFTNSYARITYGTTSLQASLPESGVYQVTAILEIVNGLTASDVYTAKFYDATNAADITSSERKIDHLPASKTGQLILSNVVTTTGAANIQVYGVNTTAARGTSVSTNSSIAWVKVG